MNGARAGRREETPGARSTAERPAREGRRAGYQIVELPGTATGGRGAGRTTGYANWWAAAVRAAIELMARTLPQP